MIGCLLTNSVFGTMRLRLIIISVLLLVGCQNQEREPQPNIILLMADDLGWDDVGFNGSEVVHTPNLDRLAASGIIFNRFYAASPVCSPTRASVLTGRHPARQGITTANTGHLLEDEITLPELLKDAGYATGHFGKWHLGTLTTRIKDSNRGAPGDSSHFSVPTQHGFDQYFATEAKVPTYDPMVKPVVFDTLKGESLRYGWANVQTGQGEPYGTHYWTNPDTPETENVSGDNSRVIMDRVLPFIDQARAANQPFFSVVWLHTPHLPMVSDAAHRAQFEAYSHREQLYYGAIAAMDEQIGRLWDHLDAQGLAGNTLLWFASDNGPENNTPGSAGSFRARKRSLYEGGVRVPAFVLWPNRLQGGQTIDVPAVTSDYLPTIMNYLNLPAPVDRPLDGTSLVPLIAGETAKRDQPIGFHYYERQSWVEDIYKLVSEDDGQTYELYDLINDPEEKQDLSASHPERVKVMKAELVSWLDSIHQ